MFCQLKVSADVFGEKTPPVPHTTVAKCWYRRTPPPDGVHNSVINLFDVLHLLY